MVTRADLRAEAAELRAEIAELRLEVKGEFARIELERLQRRLKLLTTAVPMSTFAAILGVGILT